ncbi:Uncharacterized conserved protein YecT, DUF1311 family [Oryzisolibacter propanilivorax]|uniref:Uncharacterized conserved protein YecT, DUF1311 family n=1 Tax=Oryzisolibacter propanilivorax TaxID=1527607 RepID=A0A1G9QC28_9BURK|nr:lysozyme inhibitor LprI family protein [Oryzisolibacter propanilivorax]SDM08017.1 Uncharacterized conserved protein YecT, DUF1311 family [Oryzisolibacter propanilivorax]
MTKTIAASLLLACLALPAHADQPAYSPRYQSCMDRAGGVTVSMLDCIGDEHGRQDQRLNQAYRTLTGQLAPSRRKGLVAAQRLWLQYRDANCGFYADPDGGTLAGVSAALCRLQMTTQRAQELQDLAP